MTSNKIVQIILKADEGKYLTNGETYGKTVVLPEASNTDDWYEISEAEYQENLSTLDEVNNNE